MARIPPPRGPPDPQALLRRLKEMAKKRREQYSSASVQFGRLLKAYRKHANVSQAAVAKRADLPQSHISDYENQKRKPPKDRKQLEAIAESLNLSAADTKRLFAAATGNLEALADQVLLAPEDIGQEVGGPTDYSEAWVIGFQPLEFDRKSENAVYEAVSTRIANGGVKYVYWIPNVATDSFDSFRARLERDVEHRKGGKPKGWVARYLECIQAPRLLCIHHIAIYNPCQADREGRFAAFGKMNGSEAIVGAWTLSATHTGRLCELLVPIYAELSQTKRVVHEGAEFLKYYPQPEK